MIDKHVTELLKARDEAWQACLPKPAVVHDKDSTNDYFFMMGSNKCRSKFLSNARDKGLLPETKSEARRKEIQKGEE